MKQRSVSLYRQVYRRKKSDEYIEEKKTHFFPKLLTTRGKQFQKIFFQTFE